MKNYNREKKSDMGQRQRGERVKVLGIILSAQLINNLLTTDYTNDYIFPHKTTKGSSINLWSSFHKLSISDQRKIKAQKKEIWETSERSKLIKFNGTY